MGGRKGPKKCSFCDYSHKLTSQVRRHEQQTHGDHAVECTVVGCGLRVAYNRLAGHIRQQHPEALNAIDSSAGSAENALDELIVLAQKQELAELNLEDNKLISTENKPNRTEPNKKPPTTTTIDGVLRATELAVGQHGCPQCGQRKSSREALRKHIARVHDKRYKREHREKNHRCDWADCDRSFTTAGKLADHRNSHTGERPYSCDHCKREFIAKAEYARHLRKYHATSIRQLNRQIEQLVGMGYDDDQ